MTRLTPDQLLIVNLKQGLPERARGYMTREQAYAALKQRTGQDFGYDVSAWKRWFLDNKKKP